MLWPQKTEGMRALLGIKWAAAYNPCPIFWLVLFWVLVLSPPFLSLSYPFPSTPKPCEIIFPQSLAMRCFSIIPTVNQSPTCGGMNAKKALIGSFCGISILGWIHCMDTCGMVQWSYLTCHACLTLGSSQELSDRARWPQQLIKIAGGFFHWDPA